MTTNLEQVFDKNVQMALADEIVTTAAAVISNASAPDSAYRALEKSRQDTLTQEQRAAAAAMQAYGMRCAGEVFTSGLDDLAAGRADELRVALESNCENDALRLLDKEPDAGAEFKSEMVRAIASKCAELVASEIDRVKKGRFTILNEDDQKTFDRQHDDRLKRRTQAITEFLSSLPERYPSFGTNLFADIRRNVQREIEEKYKSPDIHAAVGTMFSDALNAMSPEVRKKIAS